MSKVWIVLVILALLSFTAVAFGGALDDGDPPAWERNTPNVTYVRVYGAPYNCDSAVYDYDDYGWIGGTESGSDLFSVMCDVEMWLNMHLDAHDIYYHKADGTTSMNAVIGGSLECNNGIHLFVAVPTDQQGKGEPFLQNLYFVENGFGYTGAAGHTSGDGSPIPMTWELRDDGALGDGYGAWTAPLGYSTAGNNGQLHGYSFSLAGDQAGMIHFQIRNTITPAEYQADGEYRMDPMIAVSPTL